MTRHHSTTSDLQQPIRHAAAHPWIEKLARFGFAAKGFVYFVVGLLALQAAFGTGGRTTDTNGALTTIVSQPFGKGLLALVAIGLLGYALWRIVQTLFDPEHQGEKTTPKHIAQRLGYGFSAIAYLGLALTSVKLILGSATKNGDSTPGMTAQLMAQPFGRWLVGIVGLVAIGVGLSYLYQAYKADFQRHLNLHQMSPTERRWTKRLGQFGIGARGLVFAIIGIFLILAALRANANEARGVGGALAALAAQPFGPWLLGTVALGFIAYSFYSWLEARYRRIEPPSQ
jgi:hypothetical protein